MIITLNGADFSASNIGTLSTWRITRSLGTGAVYNGVTSVDKGASFSATITIAEGYEISEAGVTVTMGGVGQIYTINGNVITISIAEVTGNIVIKVPTVNIATGEEEKPDVPNTPVIDPKAPIVDLQLTSAVNDTIPNIGTGGAAYNAIISTPKTTDSYAVTDGEFILNGHAYADVPYGFKAGDKFTIVLRTRWKELSTNQYQRAMRTEQDMPGLFYSYTSGFGIGAKLAGTSSNNFKSLDARCTVKNPDTGSALNTAYLVADSGIAADEMHTYVWVADGTKIYYYIDGDIMASQDESAIKTSVRVGLGDNDTSKTYNANAMAYDMFRIYDYAMTADEVTLLTN